MCLVLFAYKTHPRYRLVLAANRDEFYARPTQALGFWNNSPEILAGRDLKAGGTWLGMTLGGRIAAITNYREPQTAPLNGPSRGDLVRHFLESDTPPLSYAQQHHKEGLQYAGYNLIVGNGNELVYVSNRRSDFSALAPGVYGLSNRFLDTPWPKVASGKQKLTKLIRDLETIQIDAIFNLLTDQSLPDERELPNTGVGMEWERILAPLFITSATYGTRSSSVILWEYSGRLVFSERVFNPDTPRPDVFQTYEHTLNITV